MQEIDHIIIRSLQGSLPHNELAQLTNWRESSESNEQYFRDMEKLWLKSSVLDAERLDRGWQTVAANTVKPHRVSRKLWSIKYGWAAVVALFLASGGIVYLNNNIGAEDGEEMLFPGTNKALLYVEGNGSKYIELGSINNDTVLNGVDVALSANKLEYKQTNDGIDNTAWSRLVTPRGGEYSVVFSDGTTVWVNAESELRYPSQFHGKERKVYVKGEAYFKVKADESRPFIVDLNGTEVIVTGTEFNVCNYNNAFHCATLVSGKIKMQSNGDTVCLNPGQQARFIDKQLTTHEVDVDEFTDWRNGYFIYREKPLDVILQELSRWYDFEYEYRDNVDKHLLITAKLQKFDRVDALFDIISNATGVKITQKPNRTIIVGDE
ncbi:MAG: FecR family protein [Marinifilaceae bacterium]